MKIARSMRRVSAIASAGAVAALALAAPASAVPSSSEEACWFNIDTGVTQCFKNYDALLAAHEKQTGRPLVKAPGKDETGVKAAAVETATADYVLAILYDNTYYSGATYSITTTRSDFCNTSFYNGNIPSSFNDRASSFQAYGYCQLTIFENSNQTAASYGKYAKAPQLYALDNRGSSYRIQA